jgi:hypothetical protein
MSLPLRDTRFAARSTEKSAVSTTASSSHGATLVRLPATENAAGAPSGSRSGRRSSRFHRSRRHDTPAARDRYLDVRVCARARCGRCDNDQQRGQNKREEPFTDLFYRA